MRIPGHNIKCIFKYKQDGYALNVKFITTHQRALMEDLNKILKEHI